MAKRGRKPASQIKEVVEEKIEEVEIPDEEEPVEVSSLLTEIEVAQPIKCCIGPTWYDFKVGKKYKVPVNVREVLKESGNLKIVY